MYSVQCILGYPNLDYPNTKFRKPHPHYEGHVGLGDCEILQNGVFQSSKAMWSAENILRSWIFASSWLQIAPIRHDDRLQSQNPQRKWPTQVNFTYPNKFAYLNTSQIYHDRRCSDNRRCTVLPLFPGL